MCCQMEYIVTYIDSPQVGENLVYGYNNHSKYTEVIKARNCNTEVGKKMEEGINLTGCRKTRKDQNERLEMQASMRKCSLGH